MLPVEVFRDHREVAESLQRGQTKALFDSDPAQPFLKWAGGKSQLLPQLEPLFPRSITSYCEPFMGGGAVFFHLRKTFPLLRTMLRDINADLVNCYTVVRDQPLPLIEMLDRHLESFRAEQETYYYKVRSQHELKDPVGRAARMIFLNKTCYNGLWRVNGRGRFNVPVGSYRPDKVSLYVRENLLAVSRYLLGADIGVGDFRQTLSELQPGTFTYLDPPYHPISRTANFTSYTKEQFGKAEQEELAALFAQAAGRNVKLMLSNSDTPLIRDLYKDFRIIPVQARRAVNCHGAKRGSVPEVVVLNY